MIFLTVRRARSAGRPRRLLRTAPSRLGYQRKSLAGSDAGRHADDAKAMVSRSARESAWKLEFSSLHQTVQFEAWRSPVALKSVARREMIPPLGPSMAAAVAHRASDHFSVARLAHILQIFPLPRPHHACRPLISLIAAQAYWMRPQDRHIPRAKGGVS
jgi:hypothetical protein